jgi:hypothetical protein
MWPFRRRSVEEKLQAGDSVDLDELGELVDTTPVKSYLNLLLIEMAGHGEEELMLRQSTPLPWPEGYDEEELPAFSTVINRLKVMSGLDPVIYHAPREGKIEEIGIRLQDDKMHSFALRTRFDDISGDRTVHLRLERLD